MTAQLQVSAQECVKDISTNPNQPFNNHPFQSGRYNPWINSDFNIGGLENGNVPPMPLNNQITWQISDFVFGSAFEMRNPFIHLPALLDQGIHICILQASILETWITNGKMDERSCTLVWVFIPTEKQYKYPVHSAPTQLE